MMDSFLNITFFVMARRVSHREVVSKFDPIEFSPLRCIRAASCFVAVYKDTGADQPRNLARLVTVE